MTHPDRADERLDVGMAAQRTLVDEAVRRGAVPRGWKAGLGTTAARAALGTDAPLVGHLLDTTWCAPGSSISLEGWSAPIAEAELALRIGEDVPAGVAPEEAIDHVDALAPAIELVDLDPPPTDVARILAGNLFHRAWSTGAFRPLHNVTDLRTSRARVRSMGLDLEVVTDVEAATGSARDVVAEVFRIATRYGRGLVRGDVIILGSMVPPQAVLPGGAFAVTLDDHPPLSVRFD
jgi:2-keto-4-pentenoate hydratase